MSPSQITRWARLWVLPACTLLLSLSSASAADTSAPSPAPSDLPAVPANAKWTVRDAAPQMRALLGGFHGASMLLLGGSGFTVFDSGFKSGGAYYAGTSYDDGFDGFYTYGGWIAGWDFKVIGHFLKISPEFLVGIAGSVNTALPGASLVLEPSTRVSLRLANGISLGLDLGAHFVPMFSQPAAFMIGLTLNFRSQWVEWLTDEGRTTHD